MVVSLFCWIMTSTVPFSRVGLYLGVCCPNLSNFVQSTTFDNKDTFSLATTTGSFV
jgi:hypothetical protein